MPEAVTTIAKKPTNVAAPTPKQAKADSLVSFELDRVFRHSPERGVTREDLTQPGYFTAAGDGRLATFDKIDVLGPNGEYWCQLLVTFGEPGYAPIVEELQFRDLSHIERGKHDGIPAGHKIQFDAQRHVFTGVRTHDHKTGRPLDQPIPLTQDLPRYEEARSQLMNHASLRT